MPDPLYLIASERSGTNLLRRRLTQHQNVYYGASPAHHLKHLFFHQWYYGDLSEDAPFKLLIKDALDLCYVHFSPWDIDLTVGDVFDGFNKTGESRNIIQLSHYLMQRYAQKKDYQTYFCKDNHIFEFTPYIENELPASKFIYLYRDPRDYVLSQIKRPGVVPSVVNFAKLWTYEQSRSISCWKDLYRKRKCFQISYEDLIAEEKDLILSLCEFLGVDYIPERKNTEENIVGNVHEWENLNNETITSNSNKFMKELSRRDIDIIESECWHPMTFLGYKTINRNRPAVPLRIKMIRFAVDRLKWAIKSKLFNEPKEMESIRKRAELLKRIHASHG